MRQWIEVLVPFVLRRDYEQLRQSYSDLQDYAAAVSRQSDMLIQRLVEMEGENASMGERFAALEKKIEDMERRETLLAQTIARMVREADSKTKETHGTAT